jgi:hypothetical protein
VQLAAQAVEQAQPQQQQPGLSSAALQQRQEQVALQVCNTLLDKVLQLEARLAAMHGEGCDHLLSQLRSTLKTYQLTLVTLARRRA